LASARLLTSSKQIFNGVHYQATSRAASRGTSLILHWHALLLVCHLSARLTILRTQGLYFKKQCTGNYWPSYLSRESCFIIFNCVIMCLHRNCLPVCRSTPPSTLNSTIKLSKNMLSGFSGLLAIRAYSRKVSDPIHAGVNGRHYFLSRYPRPAFQLHSFTFYSNRSTIRGGSLSFT